MIGYMLQQALKNSLPQREVSVLLTRVEVDAADPAFSNPTKYIGPVYSEAQAKALAAEKGWVFKADGSYVRRVVPSPQPKRIVESDAITALIQRDHGDLQRRRRGAGGGTGQRLSRDRGGNR